MAHTQLINFLQIPNVSCAFSLFAIETCQLASNCSSPENTLKARPPLTLLVATARHKNISPQVYCANRTCT